MPDREKVIKGCENWVNNHKDEDLLIAYSSVVELLAILKDQEAFVPGGDSGMCEICSFYERSLSVKPHYNARTNWYECGACKFSMTSGMHCKGILIPAYKVGFCAKCGKAVMWE